MERELDSLYKTTYRGERRGKRLGNVRRIGAYVLKGIAAGGSLVVATGYLPQSHQAVAVAILVAVFVDGLSSNHKRLLAEVKAGYAFEFLRERVRGSYNRQLDPLISRLKTSPPPKVKTEIERGIEALQQNAHRELSDGIQDVRSALADADLKALEALALDNERAAAFQGQTPKPRSA